MENKRLIGLFAGLGVLVLLIVLGNQMNWLGQSRKDWNFAVKKADRVQKVFLAGRSGEPVTLERYGDHWTLNGKVKARPAAMEGLLQAITQVELKYIPPKEAVEPMIKSLASEGIKVEVYGKKEKPIQQYYVGGSTSDERGTYMIHEGSNQPYVMHIPGWEGNIRFRYNLQGDDWRDRSVFAEDPSQIATLTVNYPEQREASFRLNRAGKGFEVTPFYSEVKAVNQAVRQGSPEAYLEGFRRLVAEDFRNNLPEKEKLLQSIPFCTIAYSRADGSSREVRFFPIYPDHPADKVQRYFAQVKGEDLFLVQFHLVEKYFWGYASFFDE